jgi:adenine phosphoribosyltransferase
VSKTYDLEYGKDTLEMHADAIVKGQRVLIVDDVLATGGTMKACCDLVEGLGGKIVGVAVLTELLPLGGRAKVAPHQVHSVLKYE